MQHSIESLVDSFVEEFNEDQNLQNNNLDPNLDPNLDSDKGKDNNSQQQNQEKNDDDEENENNDENQDDVEEKPLIKELQELVGIEAKDEIPDSVEGIANYVKLASKEIANQELNNIFNFNPELKTVFEYVMNGGDINKYTSINQEALEIENLDLSTEFAQRKIVELELKEQGYDAKTIAKQIDRFHRAGLLEEQAKDFKEIYLERKAIEKQQIAEQQALAAQKQAEDDAKYWNSIKEKVTVQGKFNDIVIPQIEREKFFEYLAKPVKEGKSQAEIDTEIEDVETTLALNYLRFKKFDLSSLVQSKAKTEKTQSLRNRLSGNTTFSGKNQRTLDIEKNADSFERNFQPVVQF